jgi:peptide/nickel transport system permease protein
MHLATFAARRLGASMLILVALTFVTFAMFERIPNEPAFLLVDPKIATRAQIAKARHDLGVDRPFFTRYAEYVGRLAHGDFGRSWATIGYTGGQLQPGIPIRDELFQALGVTASVVLGGLALVLLLSLPLGIVSAARPRSAVDRGSVAVSLIGISTHPLVIALLLQLFVANRWGWLPGSGYCNLHGPDVYVTSGISSVKCGGPKDWASHLVLPWITFALFFIALYSRIIRVRMLAVLGEPYIRTARAKGASNWRVVRRHVMPNALAPIMTMTAMDIGTALGVAAYVEVVFHLPGLGARMVSALALGIFDVPVVIGIVFFTAVIILALNLVVDLVQGVIDPRAFEARRESARSGRVT